MDNWQWWFIVISFIIITISSSIAGIFDLPLLLVLPIGASVGMILNLWSSKKDMVNSHG